jgi:sugar/nucleoside kinase (ribokinase family)
MSDAFVIARHGDDFRALIAEGLIDILFANEHELAALTGLEDFHEGLDQLAAKVPCVVVTRSEKAPMPSVAAKPPMSRPSPSRPWSTPPARAICLPPVSCSAMCAAWIWKSA